MELFQTGIIITMNGNKLSCNSTILVIILSFTNIQNIRFNFYAIISFCVMLSGCGMELFQMGIIQKNNNNNIINNNDEWS